MGVVTGLTKARILQIEEDSIVDAHLSGDNLILVNRGGEEFNVGSVRGPQGGFVSHTHDQSEINGLVSALAGKQPVGSYAAASHNHDDRYFTEGEVTTALAGKANVSHQHAFGDLILTELGNAVNLNSITVPGDYTQSSNAEAAAGSNYPCPFAGLLKHRNNPSASMIWQEYIPYALQDGIRYWRGWYNNSWSAWKEIRSSQASLALLPRALARITSAVNVFSGENPIVGWTEIYDTAPGGAFDPATGTYTIPSTGWYSYGMNVTMATANSRRFISARVNSVNRIRAEGPETNYAQLAFSSEDFFNAGDVITLRIYSASAITGGIEGTTSPSNFYIRRVSD